MLDHPEIAVKRSHANPARAVLGLKQAPVAQLDRAAASTGACFMKPQSLGVVQTPPRTAIPALARSHHPETGYFCVRHSALFVKPHSGGELMCDFDQLSGRGVFRMGLHWRSRPFRSDCTRYSWSPKCRTLKALKFAISPSKTMNRRVDSSATRAVRMSWVSR